MTKKSLLTALIILGLGVSSSAQAGVYTDDLSKCLVKSSSAADQADLVRWIFSAIALHPDIQSMASISVEQRSAINKKAGALFERLLVTDCHQETLMALKYEGASSLEKGFGTLGEIASRGLFAAPEVNAGMGDLTANINMAKVTALFKEAGIETK